MAVRKIGKDRLVGALSPHGIPTALDISHRSHPTVGELARVLFAI